mgnify:CR=1 FL=1
MFKTDVQKLRNALEFTRVYKENANRLHGFSAPSYLSANG